MEIGMQFFITTEEVIFDLKKAKSQFDEIKVKDLDQEDRKRYYKAEAFLEMSINKLENLQEEY